MDVPTTAMVWDVHSSLKTDASLSYTTNALLLIIVSLLRCGSNINYINEPSMSTIKPHSASEVSSKCTLVVVLLLNNVHSPIVKAGLVFSICTVGGFEVLIV